jgi:hypothetical protein
MEKGEPIIRVHSRSSECTSPSFSVIAVYDGCQAEMQVNRTFAWLHQCFSADLRMSFKVWSFERLMAGLDIHAMSVRTAIEADLIIISTSSGIPLPDHIIRWLDSFSGQKQEGKALVLVLEDDAQSPCPNKSTLCGDLKQWAARWHAADICCLDISHQPSRQSILRRINERFYRGSDTSPD